MKQQIYNWIFTKILRWKLIGTIGSEVSKAVVIVIPHTSWHDFYIGLLVRGIIGLEIHYVAKKELFAFPFGYYFKYMGGAPIDRTKNQNTVDAIVTLFQQRSTFRLAIAPEGTRRKVDALKSGFYYIALQANVPIIPVALDYGTRTVSIFPEFKPTGNYEQDLEQILHHYQGVQGKLPENAFDAAKVLSVRR